MSNTNHITTLIEVRDQLTGEAADFVQLAIDKLMEPFEIEWANRKPTDEEINESIFISNLFA